MKSSICRPSTRQLISHVSIRHSRRALSGENHADQAVVAEAVGKPEPAAPPIGRRGHRRHLVLGIAAGGEIELVRLVDQLRHARQRLGIHRPVARRHFQPA